MNPVLKSLIIAALTACAPAYPAWAEPADVSDASANPAINQPAPKAMPPAQAQAVPTVSGPGTPIADACSQFSSALNVAAANYEDFADASAGNGNLVNYRDPTVSQTNVVGRTALRESAAVALSASATAGLPPDVADPMRSWALHAAKLVVIMGLRGGGDSLNSNANQLNTDGTATLLACARHA